MLHQMPPSRRKRRYRKVIAWIALAVFGCAYLPAVLITGNAIAEQLDGWRFAASLLVIGMSGVGAVWVRDMIMDWASGLWR